MGKIDRITRIIIAAIVAILYWQNIIEGTLAYILLAISGVFVLTSFISFCPIYAAIGLKTTKDT